MALNTTVIGQTYSASQVSVGSVVEGSADYTYTETATSPLPGNATITSYDPATNAITFTIGAGFLSATGSGTVIGNDADSFLISGSITSAFGVQTGVVYITNTAGEQPGAGSSVVVPNETTSITYTPACYCRGTLIRTPDGPRPVEDLAEGDLVHTLHGGVTAISWIGRRSYGGRFLRANPQLRPIRFRPGSLGPCTPSRDLLVSRRHAMLLDGALVPAELLVNGVTIVADTDGDTVDYFHIELPSHDAVWAEDALSETFVDDGSRGVFHNAGTFRTLDPGATAARPVFCAPRVEDGDMLTRIRSRLAPASLSDAA